MIKHIKPGDVEFDKISQQITPINRVHSASFVRNKFYEERAPFRCGRRETIEKI